MTEKIPQEYERALKSALNMLAYAECTSKSLREKLAKKGYEKEAIDFCLDYVINRGFLDEKRYLERFVEYLATKKMYGKRRIGLEIYKKGFSTPLVRQNLPYLLEEYDFGDIAFAAAKKLKKDDREKLFAALIRLGHSSTDASSACKKILDDTPIDE